MCLKCADVYDDNHVCVTNEHTCKNCLERCRKLNMDIDYKHRADDTNCPTYKNILASLKSKINYEENF